MCWSIKEAKVKWCCPSTADAGNSVTRCSIKVGPVVLRLQLCKVFWILPLNYSAPNQANQRDLVLNAGPKRISEFCQTAEQLCEFTLFDPHTAASSLWCFKARILDFEAGPNTTTVPSASWILKPTLKFGRESSPHSSVSRKHGAWIFSVNEPEQREVMLISLAQTDPHPCRRL